MLAQTADDVDEALAQLSDEASLEWKLDGARIQVHKSGDEVRVFTRNLRDVTSAVPEVVAAVSSLAVREAILDGEVIALRSDGAPHPFQVTMQRFGRKLDVDRMRADIPLTPFFFDCLYADGESLVDVAAGVAYREAERRGAVTGRADAAAPDASSARSSSWRTRCGAATKA